MRTAAAAALFACVFIRLSRYSNKYDYTKRNKIEQHKQKKTHERSKQIEFMKNTNKYVRSTSGLVSSIYIETSHSNSVWLCTSYARFIYNSWNKRNWIPCNAQKYTSKLHSTISSSSSIPYRSTHSYTCSHSRFDTASLVCCAAFKLHSQFQTTQSARLNLERPIDESINMSIMEWRRSGGRRHHIDNNNRFQPYDTSKDAIFSFFIFHFSTF